MKKNDLPVLELIGVLALVAISTTVVFTLFPAMKSEALAAWAQAVFGAGAIATTVWFATNETRRRRREANDMAKIAVAAIWIKVDRVSNTVDFLIEALQDEFVRGFGLNYGDFILAIEDAGIWEADEIYPLIILPRGVAANLAAVRSSLQHVILLLKRIQKNSTETVGKHAERFDTDLLERLRSIRASLSVAQQECRAYTLQLPRQ